jgi:hypothetical protein
MNNIFPLFPTSKRSTTEIWNDLKELPMTEKGKRRAELINELQCHGITFVKKPRRWWQFWK